MRGSSFLLLLFLMSLSLETVSAADDASHADIMAAIYGQHQLEQEGQELERIGNFSAAIEKYIQAVEFDLKINGDARGQPMAYIVGALQKEGKYVEALEKLKFLRTAHLTHEYYIDWVKELEAIIEYEESGQKEIIYKHIEYLRNKYKAITPPNAYDQVFGITAIETNIRLYDTIGDYDAGIAFIDEILAYFRTGKAEREG